MSTPSFKTEVHLSCPRGHTGHADEAVYCTVCGAKLTRIEVSETARAIRYYPPRLRG